MTKRFCVDIDGVLADSDPVIRWVIRDLTEGRVNLDFQDIVDFRYPLCKDINGNQITEAEWEEIHDAFSEPYYISGVDPMLGAVKGMQQLAEVGDIFIATARLPKTAPATLAWLEKHDIPFEDILFTQTGKKHEGVPPFDLTIEDNYNQAVAFAESGSVRNILVIAPWNMNYPPADGVEWHNSWASIMETL